MLTGASRQCNTKHGIADMSKNNRARRKQKLAQKAAQKKRRRERSKARDEEQTLAPTFQMFPNPFEGLSDDLRRLAIKGIAKKSDEDYQEALSDLRAILRRSHPLDVLSHMSYYSLLVGVDETVGITKLDSDFEIHPYHVGILQALSLQIEPHDLSRKPLKPNVLMQVWNNVITLCDTHNFRRLDPTGADLPDDEKAIGLAQEMIRGLHRPSGTGAITLKSSASHVNSTDRSTRNSWMPGGLPAWMSSMSSKRWSPRSSPGRRPMSRRSRACSDHPAQTDVG